MKFLLNGVALAAVAAASYSCVNFDVPLSFEAQSLPTTFPPFENHYQTVNFLNAVSARNAASSPSPFGAPANITVEVTIAAQYCSPSGKQPSTVQVLTHGLGFDHTYWDFGGISSQYNYIYAATAAGYATLSYDRMGNGNSTIEDPYTVQQLGPETGVAIQLTALLRAGGLSKHAGCPIPKPSKVVHVGHSFGSAITSELVATEPSLSDAIVLTGFSTVGKYAIDFAISSNFHIAKENQARLSAYESNGWLTWGDELSNQYSFLHYPAFSPKVLAVAEATKYPFAIGEFLTAATPANVSAFYKPVLIISGEYDRIFCGADCTGILPKAKPYYANAKPFETYVQPNTGHGMNLHFNASGTYQVVNDFFAANV